MTLKSQGRKELLRDIHRLKLYEKAKLVIENINKGE